MADERISSFITEGAFAELKAANDALLRVVTTITEANNAARNAEGFTRQAKTFEDVAKGANMIVDANGNMVRSFNTLNDIITSAENVKAKYNGTTKEVLQTGQALIRLNAEEAKVSALNAKAMGESAKARQSSAKATEAETKAKIAGLKASEQEMKNKQLEQRYVAALAKEKERLVALQEKEQAKLLASQTAYARVNAEYKDAAAAAKELGAQYFLLEREIESLNAAQAKGGVVAPGDTSAIAAKKAQLLGLGAAMETANAQAFKLHSGLLKIEQAVGQSQRRVGDYASSVFALTQVLREAPAFAQSFQLGLLAISNNLPILIDEFKAVRVATGSTMTALKVFGASLFSVGNIFTLAFTGLMLLVQAMQSMKKETEGTAESVNMFDKELKNVAETVGRELGSLNELVLVAQDMTKSYKERGAAVDELQKKYPDVFANMNREIILNGDITKSYDAVSAAIIAKAEAQARGNILQDAIEKRTRAQLELDAAANKEASTFVYLSQQRTEQLQAQVKSADDVIASIKKQNEAESGRVQTIYFLSAAEKKAFEDRQKEQKRRALLTEEQRKEEDRKAKQKGPKAADLTKEELSADVELAREKAKTQQLFAEREAQAQKAIAEDEGRTLDQRLAAYNKYVIARLDAAQFGAQAELDAVRIQLKKIAELEAKPGKRTKEEQDVIRGKELLNQRLINLLIEYNTKIAAIQEDGFDAQDKLTDKADKDAIAATKDRYKQAVELARKGIKDINDATADEKDKAKKKEALRNKEIGEGINFAQNLSDLESTFAQRRIAELDAEIQKIHEKRDAEINAINLAGGTEEERTKKIAAANIKAAAEEKRLEQEKITRQRRAAAFEKAVAIGQIIAQTALAVITAFAEGGPVYAALAAGTGALALAKAIATPLPQYEHGTQGKPHKGGPARLFEKGKTEAVIEPGKPVWFGNTEGIYDLAKGAQVLSQDQLIKLTQQYAVGMPALVPVAAQGGKLDTSGLEREMQAVRHAIESKPAHQTSITGSGIEHLVMSGQHLIRYELNLKH